MAATDRVEVVDDKKLKKEKKSKDKSEKKRSSEDGVRKEKKDKKKDKAKQEKLARALDAHLQADAAAQDETPEVDPEDIIKPAEELVPFALPLADDKTHKKIYKLIKKGASASRSPRLLTLSEN